MKIEQHKAFTVLFEKFIEAIRDLGFGAINREGPGTTEKIAMELAEISTAISDRSINTELDNIASALNNVADAISSLKKDD